MIPHLAASLSGPLQDSYGMIARLALAAAAIELERTTSAE